MTDEERKQHAWHETAWGLLEEHTRDQSTTLPTPLALMFVNAAQRTSSAWAGAWAWKRASGSRGVS
jgi:hypothetical protein